MARWIVAGLIVLNVMLGVGVWLRVGERHAQAQIGKNQIELATVAGQANNNSIIYILNVNTGWLTAVKNDVINKKMEFLSQRKVDDDLKRLR